MKELECIEEKLDIDKLENREEELLNSAFIEVDKYEIDFVEERYGRGERISNTR